MTWCSLLATLVMPLLNLASANCGAWIEGGLCSGDTAKMQAFTASSEQNCLTQCEQKMSTVGDLCCAFRQIDQIRTLCFLVPGSGAAKYGSPNSISVCKASPSPAPGPPPTNIWPQNRCQGAVESANWPTFHTKAALAQNSKWQTYFMAVYGQIPDTGYPICTSSLTWIYVAALAKAGITTQAAECNGDGLADGAYVKHMSACCDPPVAAFIWSHGNVGHSIPSNTWAEIMHLRFAGDVGAAWYYLAQGSSVWWNVGKTKAYRDHPDGVLNLLNGRACHDADNHHDPTPTECEKDFVDMYNAARAQGLDSLQFTHHYDCKCGDKGHSSWGFSYICQTEIIDLNGHGDLGSCASTKPSYRAGWDASKACTCSNADAWTNCQGFGLGMASLSLV